MEFSTVTVSAFVATLNEVTKKIAKDVFNKEANKFIPLFSLGYGLALAMIAWFSKIPGFGSNVIEAAFIGITSGAAATGYHQIGKQLWDKPPDDGVTDEQTDGVEEVGDLSTPSSDFDLVDVTDTEDATYDDEEVDDEALPENINIDVDIPEE